MLSRQDEQWVAESQANKLYREQKLLMVNVVRVERENEMEFYDSVFSRTRRCQHERGIQYEFDFTQVEVNVPRCVGCGEVI